MANNLPFVDTLLCDLYQNYSNELSHVLLSPIYKSQLNSTHKVDGIDYIINFRFNTEHFIRSPVYSNHPFAGKIRVGNSSFVYKVEGYPFKNIHDTDFIIDYSLTNIYQVITSNKLPEYNDKLVYVPPLLYPYDPGYDDSIQPRTRNVSIMTTFYVHGRPRRVQFQNMMKNSKIDVWQAYQTDSSTEMMKLLDNAKILLNIHQSPQVFTAEENRILPALLRGVVVISEESPMKELIPYHEYVIWSTIQDFPAITKHVRDNYRNYYDRIHGPDSKLKYITENMKYNATRDLTQFVNKSIYRRSHGKIYFH